jgi:hypothetical protein
MRGPGDGTQLGLLEPVDTSSGDELDPQRESIRRFLRRHHGARGRQGADGVSGRSGESHEPDVDVTGRTRLRIVHKGDGDYRQDEPLVAFGDPVLPP